MGSWSNKRLYQKKLWDTVCGALTFVKMATFGTFTPEQSEFNCFFGVFLMFSKISVNFAWLILSSL